MITSLVQRLVYGRNIISGGLTALITDKFFGLGIIEHEHMLRHRGLLFCTRVKFASLGIGNSFQNILRCTSKAVHMVISVPSDSACYINIYRKPTISVLGTPAGIGNHKDGDPTVTLTEMYQGSTFTGGIELTGMAKYIPAGIRQGGTTRSEGEEIFQPNTDYGIEIQNLIANNRGLVMYAFYDDPT